MIKLRFYFDKDKEEKWINEMAQKGYALVKFFLGVYTFEACVPGAYHYQIDLLDDDNLKNLDYLELLRETNVEIVARWYRWVFLRRSAELGEFELYSDNTSKATQYERMGKLYVLLMAIELMCSSSVINSAINGRFLGSFFSFFTVLIVLLIAIFAKLAIQSFSKAKALRKGI